MKRFYLSKLVTLAAILGAVNMNVAAQTVVTFTAGTTSYYTVPSGVFTLSVDAQGGAGGTSSSSSGAIAGKGGRVQATLNVTPGSVLQINVGTQGDVGNFCCTPTRVIKGGYNGGGDGLDYGGGGGGASDIRLAPYSLSERVIVAGGGGGTSYYSGCGDQGGNGGGLSGQDGKYCGSYNSSMSGGGGSQTTGGARSSNGTSTAGALGVGGKGDQSSYYYGPGGGGGYYGGGGGYASGGGGGSSYTNSTFASDVIHTQGTASGNGTLSFTANCTPPSAGIITGNTSICLGSNTTMSTTVSPGGSWSSTNPSVASVDATTGALTTVSVGTATISYSISYSCGSAAAGKVITVNPLPASIIGSANACLGKTITLSNPTPGGAWTSSNSSIARVGSTSGVVTGISLGNATITYKVIATGCIATQSELVNSLPSIYNVTGTGNYCLGGTGVNVFLSTGDIGINYELVKGGVATGFIFPGLGAMLDFGKQTAGTYTAIATSATTGCSQNMSGSAIVTPNPLPTQYAVTTSASGYCTGGAGVEVKLSTSATGTDYQLFSGAMAVGSPKPGTGTAISFGFQPAGTYTIVGTNTVTGCTGNMANSVTIVTNPLPNTYTVIGGGAYCAGGAGRRDTLSGSESGVRYDLYRDGVFTSKSLTGTGGVLDFGLETIAGSYTVRATNTTTTCSNTMAGAAKILVNALPNPNNVTGTGKYCPGIALPGKSVGLDYSDIGITYQLYKNGVAEGLGFPGVGAALDFGNYTSGLYTVVGTNVTTGCSNNMTGNATIGVHTPPAPYLVLNGGVLCAGDAGADVSLNGTDASTDYQLYVNSVATGGILAGSGSPASFGLQSAGGIYTVTAKSNLTGCTNNMANSVSIVVNPAPAKETVSVTAGGSYCAGGSGVRVTLGGSSTGTTYQLYLDGVALTGPGSSLSGTGSALDFGLKTATGNYTVEAMVNATTCKDMMTGSALVTVNPLPTAFSVTGGGAYCVGTAGKNVGVAFSEPGVNYQLYINGSMSGSAISGTGAPLDFGVQSTLGSYTVMAANAATGCSNSMSGSASVNTTVLPIAYSITGGGSYCTGIPGKSVGLAASNPGIDYQLYNGTIPVGGTLHGSGYPLDFGLQTVAGTYTILASNATTGCQKTMNGTANIMVNPAPNAYTVTGGGGYCPGGSGVSVGLNASESGTNYQLYNGITAVGTALAGTGSPLDFGLKTSGTYTVKATDVTTGCTEWMSGSGSVSLNATPVMYTVTGSGTYCVGDGASHVNLSGSASGTTYQLYNGTTAIGTTMAGDGSALDFGAQTASGTYTVKGTNGAGCTSTMASSAIMKINALPAQYSVTGGGNYCVGGTGVTVMLSSSDAGMKYQLYRGTTAVGFPIWGTGSGSLDMGIHTTTGTYTAKAINPATGCSSDMLANAVIGTNPVVTPGVTTSSDLGLTLCKGTVATFTATPSNGGTTPAYAWYVNGVLQTSSTTDVFAYTADTIGDVVKVTMTSSAPCTVRPTASNSSTMTVNPVGPSTVKIAGDPGFTVCPGSVVTLSASEPVLAGTAPVYTWKKGVVTVGTGVSYSYVPANNDVINLEMTSDDVCSTSPMANASATMKVTAPVAPVFTLQSNHTSGLVIGQVDTLKVVISANGGPAPTYQWIINNVPLVGETGSMLIRNNFYNKDSVAVEVTGSGVCGGLTSSKSLIMNVRNLGTQHVSTGSSDIRVLPNPNKGTFTVKGTLSSSVDEEVSLEVTNMLGQVVYRSKAQSVNGAISEQVQLNNMANGMYILNVRSGNDNSVFNFVIGQ